MTTASKNIGRHVSWNIPRWMPLLLGVVTFSNSVIIWTPNGQFWGCATLAFSERYVLKINSLSLQKCGKRVQTITKICRASCISHYAFSWILFRRCQEHSDWGFCLSVCVLLTYIPVILSFLPSQSETTTACIVTGRAQCIWFRRREEAIISHWQYEGV